MTHEELILKAEAAKSIEELMAIAKENGVEFSEEVKIENYNKEKGNVFNLGLLCKKNVTTNAQGRITQVELREEMAKHFLVGYTYNQEQDLNILLLLNYCCCIQ